MSYPMGTRQPENATQSCGNAQFAGGSVVVGSLHGHRAAARRPHAHAHARAHASAASLHCAVLAPSTPADDQPIAR
jgi:hypothetical protein